MFETACVVGAGRVGKAEAELVVLCVPDRAIAEVAAAIPAGPWIAHTSGAQRLDTLAPHERRFSVHPLQTFTLDRGPEQLDGAWSAISGESDEALGAARSLAELLGLRPFELDDENRPLYHAAATFASPFLVTIHDVAAELMEAAGAPPEALEPLMKRTIENGFEHTGPLVRDDWATVERHADEIGARRPQLLALYRALAETEAALLGARTP
jgi:predicted short-subunit dehydrogenase-like oxidoreductase (DUF2520 family)